jgi:UDP-N-acetylmuramyl pentapeptide phosphotransferase/UDP-N-acetylglucosamine-1-phosphate transferase
MNTIWGLNIAITCFLCILITGFLIPQILLISFRCNLFDEVDERKIHKGVVPRLGGIAFMPSILISILFVLGMNCLINNQNLDNLVFINAQSITFGICGILLLYLVGLADDLIGVRYRAKFVVQIASALMIICGGMWINDFHGVLGLHEVPWWVGYPLTILVVVFVINSINLIDGIDGLASGLTSIAMIIYGVTFIERGEYIYAMIAFAALGVLVPFFYYNVFGNAEKHKKIFMGDTGTLTTGYIISFLTMKILYNDGVTCQCIFDANPVIIAISPLIIPCFDVVRVYFGRLRRGNNPFLPDKTHIHHKLLAAGLSQKSAMVTIVTSSLFLSAVCIYLSQILNINFLLLFGVLIFFVANLWISKLIRQRQNK